MKKIYVGNLPYRITEKEVREIFSQYGDVHTVTLIIDRYTGKMRGFGFVEMENAEVAIKELNGFPINGRKLRVDLSHEKSERRSHKTW